MKFDTSSPPQGRRVYSVSGFTEEVKNLLESSYPSVWIEGEISNFSSPASGHCYFSLKDKNSQIRCALFRQKRLRCATQPAEGKKILLRAKVSLYPARGDFQLIVDYIEDAGEGALRRAIEILKRKLNEEGIFDQQHKQRLPVPPTCIGVITSPSGAAVRDIVSTLKKRARAIPVIIFPTVVQGDQAAQEIVNVFKRIESNPLCDVIILARGGGSLEDLQAFNDENVARAIFNSEIPVVTGVGHETDTTIADYVSDARAATPTAAAELVSESLQHLHNEIVTIKSRIKNVWIQKITLHMQSVDLLASRLKHPQESLNRHQERLLEIQRRMLQATQSGLLEKQFTVDRLRNKLQHNSPENLLNQHKHSITSLQQRMSRHLSSQLKMLTASIASIDRQLRLMNPDNIVQRGYAVLKADHKVISSVHDTSKGQRLSAQLKDGKLDVEVQ